MSSTNPTAVQIYTGYYSMINVLGTDINNALMETYQTFSSGNSLKVLS